MPLPSTPFTFLVILVASFSLVAGATKAARQILLRRAVLDIPNERSSHKTPVPRGGGWAFMIVLVPLLFGAPLLHPSLERYGWLALAVFLLAAVSWIDDRKHVHPAIRLCFHGLAAGLGCLCFPENVLLLNGYVPFWADRALIVLGWVWFINLYNFMDGIDGITGAETLSIAFGLFVLGFGQGDFFLLCLLGVLMGGSAGFLVHNWHPAKIFLGDIGSVPLGYLVGFCLLSAAMRGYWIVALLLPLYYLADSGITLARRALRGEKIWQAHREHFYQKAALGMGRHDAVVYAILFANLGLIGATAAFGKAPGLGLCAGAIIVGGLLLVMWRMGKRNGTDRV